MIRVRELLFSIILITIFVVLLLQLRSIHYHSSLIKNFTIIKIFYTHEKVYLTLKNIIKVVNIDLFRHALRKITIVFQIKVARISNYAQTLLHFFYIIDSSAFSKKLQNVILTNYLINLQSN